MRINADVRDSYGLQKTIRIIIAVIMGYGFATVFFMILASFLKGIAGVIFVVIALLMVVGLIPLFIFFAVYAAIKYKQTWITTEYDLQARDGILYFDNVPLRVTYNEMNDVLYVHNMGGNGNPARASVFLTVMGDDKENLLRYVKENHINIEGDEMELGKTKYTRY